MAGSIRSRLDTALGIFVWLLMGLGGCGDSPTLTSVASLTDTDSSTNDDGEASGVFPDDSDPVMARQAFVENELIVQPYPGADPATLSAMYAKSGATVIDELVELGLTVLAVDPNSLAQVAEELVASGLIEAVHKNYIYETAEIPNDPDFGRQWHLQEINAAVAWDITVGSEQVPIAIVDTGVDREHPDLADKIIAGWNARDGSSNYQDEMGHGTQVAGVAAALSDNRLGVAGVAWDSPLLVVRATDARGQTSGRDLAAGITWAVGQGARVINVSFAPLWSNQVIQAAAVRAFSRGALVFISAGNAAGNRDADGYEEAVFVSATDSFGELANFSDFGPFVDVAAPGTSIRTTAMGGGYRSPNGTSFASPMVAGVAALAWSANPDLRPISILNAIIDGAVDVGARGKDDRFGYGLIDAAAIVENAASTQYVEDETPPTISVTRPKNGARLTGRYRASVSARDDWRVADVVLAIDGVPVATDTRAPYRLVIDTTLYDSGAHELSFVATDLAGNSREAVVDVTFGSSAGSSSIQIEFTSPDDGDRVFGDVSIKAAITSVENLATLEWLVDGESVFVGGVSGKSTGVSFVWDSNSAGSGEHTITLIATDEDGAQGIGTLRLRR